MGSLAFKLHFSIICHTKGIMSVSYKTQKAAGLVGGASLNVEGAGFGWSSETSFPFLGVFVCGRGQPSWAGPVGKALCRGKEPESPGKGKDRTDAIPTHLQGRGSLHLS